MPENCNVVLISIDSLRADMPWNGYARPIAPRLTELEKTAVSYTRAHSVSSYTSMSLGGLLAGRLPSELTRSGYFFGTYKKDLFFPKLLQRAGVHTMGVQAHMYFKAAGFDDGFDDWKIVPGITFDGNTDRDITSPQSEQIAEQADGRSGHRRSRRFFFWAHFLDPHDLYEKHDGIDWGKGPRDRYDGEVTFTDGYVGKLIDFIRTKSWASRTIIIVTSDHGEEFGEHNMTRHGFEVWDTLVHVPLMIIAPRAVPEPTDARPQRHRSRADHPRLLRRPRRTDVRGQVARPGDLRRRHRDARRRRRSADDERQREAPRDHPWERRSSSASTETASASSRPCDRPARATADVREGRASSR